MEYGYHHSGSMATPALGTRDVRLHIVGKDCIMESPECSNCKQWAMQSANSELHPIQESVQTAQTALGFVL